MESLDTQSKSIIDRISDSVVIFNADGNITYKNRTFILFMEQMASEIQRAEILNELRTCCLEAELSPKDQSAEQTFSPGSQGNFTLNVQKIENREKNDYHHVVLIQPRKHTAQRPVHPAKDSHMLTDEPHVSLDPAFKLLLGNDSRFKKALSMAQKAAPTDFPLLIIGESGTGKELLARTIHRVSLRQEGPFVDINCAAIPDNLVESELFGYESGAFTGARRSGRPGLFEEAHNGTLFMDEIGDASLSTQSKVLRVLQEGLFKRVGGRKNIRVDVRVISATNRNLSEMINEKNFREDLLYRLNTITIHLPALRERRSDIPLLTNFFLKNHEPSKKQRMTFSVDCMDILMSYDWPGNVRELKSVVEYALIMSDRQIITPNFLPTFLLPDRAGMHHARAESQAHFDDLDLNAAILALEKEIILKALQSSSNKSEAIQKLGISRRTFYNKLKVHGMI